MKFLGKHYNIQSLDKTNLMRQYTIANCMQIDVYNEYLRVLKEGLELGYAREFNQAMLNEKPEELLSLTIKNYECKTGLSWGFFQIHES